MSKDEVIIQRIDNHIMRWLSRREYSVQELVSKLVRKGYNVQLSRLRVERFKVQGWQSDERFAANLWSTRRNQRYGSRRIIAELRQKGISKEVIAGIIDDCEKIDAEIIRALILKKKGNLYS